MLSILDFIKNVIIVKYLVILLMWKWYEIFEEVFGWSCFFSLILVILLVNWSVLIKFELYS